MERKKKNRRKATLVLALVLLAVFGLAGCGGDTDEPDPDDKVLAQLSAPVRIAGLKGPTGMGLTYLTQEPEKYEVTLYQSPDEAVAKLMADEADIAALSSNLGAVLYNKNQGDLCVLAVNTGGISYIVENGTSVINSLQDLKGKTLIASGKGGTPEYMLNRLLLNAGLNPETDVDIQWMGNHSDNAAALLSQQGAISMLPEPFVSTVTAKSKAVKVSCDLNDLWEEAYDTDLPMGIYVAKKSFVRDRAQDLKIFMEACEASAEQVNDHPADAAEVIAKNGIVENAAVAQKAIQRCNIIFEHGSDAKEMLNTLYTILFEMQPNAVGGALPADDFYYMLPDAED